MGLADQASWPSSFLLDIAPQEGLAGIDLANPLFASVLALAATTVPIYIGLLLPSISGRLEGSKRTLLYGIGIGVLFASLFDLLKETAGISTATLKNSEHLLNVLSLGAGLLAFLLIHAYRRERVDGSAPLTLLYLWALLGVGFHSVGEGIVMGYDFTTGATVLSLPQVSSFSLHKLAEGFTIGLLLVGGGHKLRHGGLSGLLGGLPVIPGVLIGISGLSGILSTYFFAIGAGATIYMLTRLVPLAGSAHSKTIIGIFLGFLYMYLSGVLHQFE